MFKCWNPAALSFPSHQPRRSVVQMVQPQDGEAPISLVTESAHWEHSILGVTWTCRILLYLATEHLRFCITTECLIYIANVLNNKEKWVYFHYSHEWLHHCYYLMFWRMPIQLMQLGKKKTTTTIFRWDAHRLLLWLPLLCNNWTPNNDSKFVHDFMDQEFREGFSGQFSLSICPVVAIRWGLGF